ncbi:MAG TPA: hypothetical protein VE998_10110, partial [Terriglobales bacterium]|nr:hypothetical protein [Terriglobales bacterium]
EVAPPSMPQPAPAGAPAWLLADRAYQIAAAEFYVGQYDDAALRFRQIAADPNSPWHELAGYLVARAYIRQATMGRDESASRVSMEAAEKQLIAILADSRLAAVHHRSRMLLDLVEARLHPAEYAGELGRRLARDDPDFEHDAGDLTLVLRRLSGRDAITMARASDLADWLNAFRSNDPSVPAYALKRWQSTHSAAWLAMAIAKAKSGDPGVADLLAAAASLPQASPASATVEFHRIRLLIAQNETGEARRLLQADLERPSLPLSALNSFKSERMQVAANLDDFLRFAQLPPAGLQGEFETAGMPGDSKDPHARLAISDEAARALSHLFPMRLLADAAQSSILVPHLHRDLALAAWTRSALLPAQQEIAVRLASTVAAADPSLAADMQAYRRTISESHSAAARQFAGAFLILQLPGLQPAVRPGFQRSTWGPGSDEGIRQIDNFRDNCWCSLKPPAPNSMNPQPAPAPPAIAFLNDQDRAAASREWNELEAQGAGPDALASAVLAYARHNPDDSRIPQALHLVVHAGRFGCNDEATGPLIHAAFGLLHSRYGQTEWAKKTPYWFK